MSNSPDNTGNNPAVPEPTNAVVTVTYGERAVTFPLEGTELSNGSGGDYLSNASKGFIADKVEAALLEVTPAAPGTDIEQSGEMGTAPETLTQTYPEVETRMVPEHGVRLRYETYEKYGPNHAYVEMGIVEAEVDGKPRPEKGAVIGTGEVWVRTELLEELTDGGVMHLDRKVKSALRLRGWLDKEWCYDGNQVYVGTPALSTFMDEHVYPQIAAATVTSDDASAEE